MKAVMGFAVGGPADYRSAVWWLGVDGADAWVAAKPRDTWWRLTVPPNAWARLTDSGESGPAPPGPGGNVTHAWRPPGPPRTSWTRGFTIMVPTLGHMEQLARPASADSDLVHWSPAAPVGQSVNFTLWAAGAVPQADHIATLPLPGGDAALVRTYEEVPDGLMRYLRRSMGYAPVDQAPGSLVNYDRGADGEALFFDLPLHSPR